MAVASLPQTDLTTRQYCPERIFTVKEIALEWVFSIDTIQRLFESEPDVFVIPGKKKHTLRIPQQVKDRLWRRMTNKRVM